MRKQFVTILGVLAAVAAWGVGASTQTASNPRFGHWKLKSSAPPPQSNVMTYEPWNGTGMKITIDSVNREGKKSQWGYTTMFDGKDMPLVGNPGTDTGAVEIVNDRINKIIYKKDGHITQTLINTLSPDGKTIDVTYIRLDPEGKMTGISFATYEKMP
jgi:hypothetical protein